MKQYKSSLFTVLALLIVVLALPLTTLAQDDMGMGAHSDIMRFADGSVVEDAGATLIRAENGLLMGLHTSDLVANEVYTVWWVVFNEPGNCSDGVCGEDDIFMFEDGEPVADENNNFVLNMDGLEASQISALFASGTVVGDNGIGNFAGSAGTGDTPGIVFGPGVVNPTTAEVHLIVRTHGPAVEGELIAQLTSFGGGCGPTDNGLPCADHQFAMFLPPM